MKNRSIISFAVLLSISSAGCSGEQGIDAAAKVRQGAPKHQPEEAILGEAAALIAKGREAEKESFSDAYRYYSESLEKLDIILSDYSAVPLATLLLRGDRKIGDYSFHQLRDEVLPKTLDMAMAEEHVLACALLLARTLEATKMKPCSLAADFAGLLAEGGENEKALWGLDFIERTEKAGTPACDLLMDHADFGDHEKAVELAVSNENSSYPLKDEVVQHAVKRCAIEGNFDKAFEYADLIKDGYTRDWALASIGESYAEHGETGKAMKAAADIQDGSALFSLLFAVVKQHVKNGDQEKALQIVQDLDTKYKRVGILAEADEIIEKALAGAGTVTSHEELEAVTLKKRHDSLLAAVAGAYLEAGNTEKALDTINLTKYASSRDDILQKAAMIYLEEERPDDAEKTAQSIKNLQKRILTLIALSKSYAKQGKTKKSASLLSQSFKMAKARDAQDKAALKAGKLIEYEYNRSSVYNALAAAFAESGNHKGAKQALACVSETFPREVILGNLIETYADLGEYGKAAEIGVSMEKGIFSIISFSDISRNCIDKDNCADAVKVFDGLKSKDDRYDAHKCLTEEYVKAGNPDEALAMLDMLTEEDRKDILIEITRLYVGIGDFDNALKTVSSMDEKFRRGAMEIVALGYAENGAEEQALKTAESITFASNIEFRIALVAGYLKKGKYDEAADAMKSISGQKSVDNDLSRRVEEYAEKGELEKALFFVAFIGEDDSRFAALEQFEKIFKNAVGKAEVKENGLLHAVVSANRDITGY